MVNVEKRGLCAFKQDLVAVVECVMKNIDRVGDVRSESLGQHGKGADDFFNIE